MLCISFSALTLLVEWWRGHPANKNLCHLSPEVLFWVRLRRKTNEELAIASLPGNYYYYYIRLAAFFQGQPG